MAVDFSFFNWKGLADGAACPLGDSPLSSTISTAAKKSIVLSYYFCYVFAYIPSTRFSRTSRRASGPFPAATVGKSGIMGYPFWGGLLRVPPGKIQQNKFVLRYMRHFEVWSQSYLLNLSFLIVLRKYIFRNLEYLISSILWKTYPIHFRMVGNSYVIRHNRIT